MPLQWTQSERCKSGDVCGPCRLLGPVGDQWRRNLAANYGYAIDDVMFACPYGKEWKNSACQNCD